MNIYRDSAIKYSRDNIPTLSGRLGFLKYHKIVKILVTAETQQKNTPYMDYGQRIEAVTRMTKGSLCLIRSRFAEKKLPSQRPEDTCNG